MSRVDSSGSKRQWTDEQLRTAVRESASIAQVIRTLGLVPAGGSYDGEPLHQFAGPRHFPFHRARVGGYAADEARTTIYSGDNLLREFVLRDEQVTAGDPARGIPRALLRRLRSERMARQANT